jgi:hypothetical protein
MKGLQRPTFLLQDRYGGVTVDPNCLDQQSLVPEQPAKAGWSGALADVTDPATKHQFPPVDPCNDNGRGNLSGCKIAAESDMEGCAGKVTD